MYNIYYTLYVIYYIYIATDVFVLNLRLELGKKCGSQEVEEEVFQTPQVVKKSQKSVP